MTINLRRLLDHAIVYFSKIVLTMCNHGDERSELRLAQNTEELRISQHCRNAFVDFKVFKAYGTRSEGKYLQ